MVVATVALGLAAIALPVLMTLCSRGIVRRNPWLGLRLPVLRASDQAWAEGHRAAIMPTAICAVLAVAGTVLALAIPSLLAYGPLIVLVPLMVALGWGTARAVQAADRVAHPAE